jgi:hypothetical protein
MAWYLIKRRNIFSRFEVNLKMLRPNYCSDHAACNGRIIKSNAELESMWGPVKLTITALPRRFSKRNYKLKSGQILGILGTRIATH